MTNNYILGGGIAGLIAKHYNPSYKIISPDVGGQLTKSKNLLMTFFIHNHTETRGLLDELKIPYKERKIKIYYNYKGKILENVDNKLRLKFIKNKLSEYNYDANSADIEDLNLSTDNGYLSILDVDINAIIKKLTVDGMINGKIKLINNNRKFIVYQNKDGVLQKEDYNKLISTLAANDFFYMLYNYKNNYHLNYLPTTFVLSKERPKFMIEDGLYYVYDNNLIYVRVQPYSENYVYEITGFPDEKEIFKQIKDILEIERRYVGIIKSEEIDDFRNINFLGRMAQWDHSIKTQEVIIKSKKIAEDNKLK